MIEIVCLKCHSKEVMTGIGLMTKTSDGDIMAELFIDEEPEAILFKSRQTSPINARVCSACGFVEFYAQNPKALKDAYDRMMKNLTSIIKKAEQKKSNS